MYLYTRLNPIEPIKLKFEDIDGLENSLFNPNHQTRFTIHGWNSNIDANVNQLTKNELFSIGDFNVIGVDWRVQAGTINYISSRNRVPEIAEVLANYIDNLVKRNLITLDKISIIGHSLGGHLAGLTAKYVTTGKIKSVIALDPAGPLFDFKYPHERVDSEHAEYVEIIHTNGGGLGFMEPIGHADFYPNYGKSQPGCGFDLIGDCAHGRAPIYFAESINSIKGFWGIECDNYSEISSGRCTSSGPIMRMGGEPSNGGLAFGIYYLETNSSAPFAFGQ